MPEELPITIWTWLLALFPLVLLLVLLVWARWSAAEAGPVGFLTAVLIALVFFLTPFFTIAVAAAKGVWDAIFILYVIWPAILLYQVTDKAGAFQAMRQGIQAVTKSQLLLVLAFGWVFSSFLQGIAGFGTPIAIVAPLLVGLGVRPLMAVVIPLIGHSWANMFGTLAVSWLATSTVVSLANPDLTALLTAALLWIPDLLAGFTICWLFGKWEGVKIGLWAVLVISAIHGGGQLWLSQVSPVLSNFIPSTIAVGAVFALAKWGPYKEKRIEESDVMQEQEKAEKARQQEANMSLHEAFFSYYVLIAVSLLVLTVPFIRDFLERFSVGFALPATTTGYGVTREAATPYSPFDIFTHPGTLLLVASVIGYAWYKWRGNFDGNVLRDLGAGTLKNALPASVAVLGFLTMSRIMDNTGQITVLALGIAAVSPAVVYAALTVFIGIIGAFMTSSNTASNVLFAPLHEQVAVAVPALSEPVVIAGQSAGGAIGNSIAPANVVLGTGPAGIPGQEGAVLRYTIYFALAAGILAGAGAVVFYLFF
ncbi:MAG: L-lactate permease [Armatimonadota bacterium]